MYNLKVKWPNGAELTVEMEEKDLAIALNLIIKAIEQPTITYSYPNSGGFYQSVAQEVMPQDYGVVVPNYDSTSKDV